MFFFLFHSACIGCCCCNCFLCLFFWLVLILSPRLSAIPWDLALMRMWPGREMKTTWHFTNKIQNIYFSCCYY